MRENSHDVKRIMPVFKTAIEMLYVKSSHDLLEQFLLLVINSFKANKNIFSNT